MSGPPGAASEAIPTRCGIDSIEIARIERMLDETPPDDLVKLFSAQELTDLCRYLEVSIVQLHGQI